MLTISGKQIPAKHIAAMKLSLLFEPRPAEFIEYLVAWLQDIVVVVAWISSTKL